MSKVDRTTRAGAGAPDAFWQGDDRPSADEALVVDIAGFEGPLDLLLHLARTQKVDLARISVLELAEQYIAFVEQARSIRLELAADYLVMAAWLAFLKSRLLIPQAPRGDEPSGEELAAALAFRLKRLEAMREAAARLVNRNRLGRDVFARGAPEPLAAGGQQPFEATLYDLLSAYASLRQRTAVSQVTIARRTVWSLAEARLLLAKLTGMMPEWTALDRFLIDFMTTPEERATVIASSFAASLEMVREGRIELRQDGAFAPLYLRRGPKPLSQDEIAALEAGRDGGAA